MLTAQFMPHFFLSSQSLFPDIFHSMHISTRLFFNCFCMMKLNTEIQTFQKLSEKLQSKVFRNDAIKCRQFSFLFFEKFIYIVLCCCQASHFVISSMPFHRVLKFNEIDLRKHIIQSRLQEHQCHTYKSAILLRCSEHIRLAVCACVQMPRISELRVHITRTKADKYKNRQRDNHRMPHVRLCEGDLHEQLTTKAYAKLAVKSRSNQIQLETNNNLQKIS